MDTKGNGYGNGNGNDNKMNSNNEKNKPNHTVNSNLNSKAKPKAPKSKKELNEWSKKCFEKKGAKIQDMSFIELENIVDPFKKPFILDLKLGIRQFPPVCDIHKKEHKLRKAYNSTSHHLGVRIGGMQVWNDEKRKYQIIYKHEGFAFDCNQFIDKIESFLSKRPNLDNSNNNININNRHYHYNRKKFRSIIIEKLILKLENLMNFLENENRFRFFSSSLLVVCEGQKLPSYTSGSMTPPFTVVAPRLSLPNLSMNGNNTNNYNGENKNGQQNNKNMNILNVNSRKNMNDSGYLSESSYLYKNLQKLQQTRGMNNLHNNHRLNNTNNNIKRNKHGDNGLNKMASGQSIATSSNSTTKTGLKTNSINNGKNNNKNNNNQTNGETKEIILNKLRTTRGSNSMTIVASGVSSNGNTNSSTNNTNGNGTATCKDNASRSGNGNMTKTDSRRLSGQSGYQTDTSTNSINSLTSSGNDRNRGHSNSQESSISNDGTKLFQHGYSDGASHPKLDGSNSNSNKSPVVLRMTRSRTEHQQGNSNSNSNFSSKSRKNPSFADLIRARDDATIQQNMYEYDSQSHIIMTTTSISKYHSSNVNMMSPPDKPLPIIRSHSDAVKRSRTKDTNKSVLMPTTPTPIGVSLRPEKKMREMKLDTIQMTEKSAPPPLVIYNNNYNSNHNNNHNNNYYNKNHKYENKNSNKKHKGNKTNMEQNNTTMNVNKKQNRHRKNNHRSKHKKFKYGRNRSGKNDKNSDDSSSESNDVGDIGQVRLLNRKYKSWQNFDPNRCDLRVIDFSNFVHIPDFYEENTSNEESDNENSNENESERKRNDNDNDNDNEKKDENNGNHTRRRARRPRFKKIIVMPDKKEKEKKKRNNDSQKRPEPKTLQLREEFDNLECPDFGILYGLESLLKLLKELRDNGTIIRRNKQEWIDFQNESIYAHKALKPFDEFNFADENSDSSNNNNDENLNDTTTTATTKREKEKDKEIENSNEKKNDKENEKIKENDNGNDVENSAFENGSGNDTNDNEDDDENERKIDNDNHLEFGVNDMRNTSFDSDDYLISQNIPR